MRTKNNRSNRGSILLYSVLAITFLSGLAAYLQTTANSTIPTSLNSKEFLEQSYLTESIGNIYGVLACQTPSIKKTKNSIASTLNKYIAIRIYSPINNSDNNVSLIGSSAVYKYISTNDFDFSDEDLTATVPMKMTIKANHQKEKSDTVKIRVIFRN